MRGGLGRALEVEGGVAEKKRLEEEMRRSYLDYAMSVIVGRALPDVRDGLKPSQRRVLFAMRQLGVTPSKSHVKCAKIVGETMGNYHPHGDSSIYDALVRMAQSFSLRMPLVDGSWLQLRTSTSSWRRPRISTSGHSTANPSKSLPQAPRSPQSSSSSPSELRSRRRARTSGPSPAPAQPLRLSLIKHPVGAP